MLNSKLVKKLNFLFPCGDCFADPLQIYLGFFLYVIFRAVVKFMELHVPETYLLFKCQFCFPLLYQKYLNLGSLCL